MRLDLAYRSVVTAFTLVAGGAAALAGTYFLLSLLFWDLKIFATLFCLGWALQSYRNYTWEDPEWMDRPRILVRTEDEEEDEDG